MGENIGRVDVYMNADRTCLHVNIKQIICRCCDDGLLCCWKAAAKQSARMRNIHRFGIQTKLYLHYITLRVI